VVEEAASLAGAAAGREEGGKPDNTGDLLNRIQSLMSAKAGPVRSKDSINEALDEIRELAENYAQIITATKGSRRSMDRVFLVRDILTTAHVYLSAMADYVEHGGRSRGSVLYTDPNGFLPSTGSGQSPHDELDLPEQFRLSLDEGALDDEIQESALRFEANECATWDRAPGRAKDTAVGEPVFHWRPRRPIPEDDDFFENVWRQFRENGNVY
jgi:hypothetical protein